MPKWGKMIPYLVIETHTLLGGTCYYVSGVYGSTPPRGYPFVMEFSRPSKSLHVKQKVRAT